MSVDIDIKKIIKENQTAALAVSAALIVLIIYVTVFAPVAGKMRSRYQECRACELQLADAHNLIDMGHRIDKEYGNRVLISEHEAAVGIEEFTRHGKSMGVNFISIHPQNVIKDDKLPYKILPMELVLEAGGEQLVKFLGSIDELKRAIVTVKSINITPDKEDRKILKVDMVINIYLSLQESHPEGA